MAKNKILKVGLDLDGVILYNPARILRPVISFIKGVILRKKETKFWVPKTYWQKLFAILCHKSSLYIAYGFDDIINLAKKRKIRIYIVTARFSFLKKDFEEWQKKIHADKYFCGCYYNKHDEQPHVYKERLIKQLNLDYFIEDNWDIVNYLTTNKLNRIKTKVYWIYNIFDRKINYRYKFRTLKEIALNINDLI